MAGTLTVGTLSDGSVSTSATTVISGSAKAWANYLYSPATIRASLNMSSVTYRAAGKYTFNMASALTDANYAMSGTSKGEFSFGIESGPTSSAAPTYNSRYASSGVDDLYFSVVFHR